MDRLGHRMALLLLPALLACEGQAAQVRGASSPDAAVQMDAGYRLGADDAPVAVVEFSDFGCPFCGRFALSTFTELQREYIEPGLVRWRYVPVSFGFAGGAVMGAAAVCAARIDGEDAFWRAHDVLYRHQGGLRGADVFERTLHYLGEAGLDRERLGDCIRDPETAAVLEANNRLAEEWFVRGTPTFLVNGAPMSGALPTEFFRKVLDTALDPSGL